MPEIYSQHIVSDISHEDSLSQVSDSIKMLESSLVYVKKADSHQTYFAFQQNIDSLLSRNFSFSSADTLSNTIQTQYGYEGVPLNVPTEKTTTVESVLLLSILFTTAAFGFGYRYFVQMFVNIFKVKTRLDFSFENSYVGFQLKSILTLQALFLESLVGYILVQLIYDIDGAKKNLWIGLVAYLVIFCVYHLLRILILSFFGAVFGDLNSMKRYISEYFSFVSLWGMFLLPVSLLLLFFHLDPIFVAVFLAVPAVVGRVVYIGKGVKIFLVQKRSIFYIFLYLCALEILPLLVLFQVLVFTYSIL